MFHFNCNIFKLILFIELLLFPYLLFSLFSPFICAMTQTQNHSSNNHNSQQDNNKNGTESNVENNMNSNHRTDLHSNSKHSASMDRKYGENRSYSHEGGDGRRKRKMHGIQFNEPRKRFSREEFPSDVRMDDWVRTPGNTPWRKDLDRTPYRGDERNYHSKERDGKYQNRDFKRNSYNGSLSSQTPKSSSRNGNDSGRSSYPSYPQKSRHFGNTPTPFTSQSQMTPNYYPYTPSTPSTDIPRYSAARFSDSRFVDPSPMPTPSYRQYRGSTSKQQQLSTSEWEDDDNLNEQDRNWYAGDEGDAVDYNSTQFLITNDDKIQKKENELKRKSVQNAKLNQTHLENLKWEENQLRLVGLGEKLSIDLDYKTEEEVKVQIIVHDVRPDFLSENEALINSRNQLIEPIVDRTCDLVVNAKKGSQLLREIRSQKDKMNAVKDILKMEGTKLGNLLGLKAQQDINDAQDSVMDDSKFMKALKNANDKSAREEIKKNRESLPIFSCKDELLNVVKDNPVTVIVGETGSGKTTQLAQYFLEGGYIKYGIVGCTQPRRVAAMSVAKRVSEEIGVELGDLVGYSIRFEDCTSEKTRLKYMTDGVLLRECLTSPTLDKYSVIIMDEAHERSLNTDVLFGLLKRALGKRRDLKLIVTSATMDANRFSEYFGNCPIYTIPGRTFPVKILYTKNPVTDYVDAAVGQAISIHTNNEPSTGDILIFMTGQEDIEITCYILQERLKEEANAAPMLILPIYSMLPSEMQTKIFEVAPPGTRKCIVATSIAETSLTVQGIFYVIDTGFTKMKVYNPTISMDTLQVYPESKAAADQRAGRAGRTGPGVCFRLFTKYQFENEMLNSNMPEIQRTNLGNVVLLLKSLNVEDVLSFDFMDPPPRQNLLNSMHQLFVLGAIDQKGKLTSLGRKMVNFPVDPSLSKMLIMSDKFGCSNEISIIISMLSVQNIFYKPKDREEEFESIVEKFFVPESDHLTFLHIFNQWKLRNYESAWCREHFLNYRSLRRVREVRAQIIDLMKKNDIPLTSAGNDWDIVRKAICSAYFHHACKLKSIADYTNLLAGMPCTLHPSSSLYGMGSTPEYVVYHELVMTTKEYMRIVTTVEGEWLAEMAPKFFSLQEDRRNRQKRLLEEKKIVESTNVIEETENPKEMAPPKTTFGTKRLNLKRRIGL